MKATQQPFTLQSDFSKLKMTGEAAQLPMYIDLAIYDLMNDGRKRSVNEVVSALAVLGYNRRDVNRRMVTMLHKNKIFVQASGGKGRVLYEMKKGAKRPDTFEGNAKTVDTVKESEIILRPAHDNVPVSYRKRRTFNLSEISMQTQDNQPQHNQANPLFVAGEPDLTTPRWSEPKPAKVFAVAPNDPVRVALWKVMSDYAWYKSSDLVTLLADFYPSDIVRYHLRAMVKLDMAEVDKSNYQEFKYRLKDGVKMPEGLEPYKPNVKPAAAPQLQLELKKEDNMTKLQVKLDQPAQSTPHPEPTAGAAEPEVHVGTGEAKPFVMPSDDELDAAPDAAGPQFGFENKDLKALGDELNVKQFTNPSGDKVQPPTNLPDMVKTASENKPKDVPLFEVGGIIIHGKRYSYKEAKVLLMELRSFGIGNGSSVQDLRGGQFVSMTRTFWISGDAFTIHQATSIAEMLIDELE